MVDYTKGLFFGKNIVQPMIILLKISFKNDTG